MATTGQHTNESTSSLRRNGRSAVRATIGSADPLPTDPNVYAMLHLAAEVIHLASHVAKAFSADSKLKDLFYGIKHSLLSMLLQAALPGVEPSWERNPGREWMLRISIASRRCVHCPFRRLSWPARCKVIERIGVRPR